MLGCQCAECLSHNLLSAEAKVIFFTCILHGDIRDWRHGVVQDLEPDTVQSMSWEDFFHQIQERVCADH